MPGSTILDRMIIHSSTCCRHVFGASASARLCLDWVSDKTVAWAFGRALITTSVVNRSQTASPSSFGDITALCGIQSKQLLAVAEAGPQPSVTLVDAASLRRRKHLAPPQEPVQVAVGSAPRGWKHGGGLSELENNLLCECLSNKSLCSSSS